MIRITSPKTQYRAAVALVAAAVLSVSAAHRASAANVDLFGTDPTTPVNTPSILSASATVALAGSNSGVFGAPGYAGTIAAGAGALNTISESFTPNGTSNSLTISESGVAGALSSTTATKSFTGFLTPGTTYSFTLTRTAGFTVGLLNGFTVALTAGGNNVFINSTGTGLLGTVDALSLFGTNNAATFTFTTPATLASTNLQAVFSSSLPVGVAGGSITFASASVTQVPEPRTVAVLMIGMTGFALLRLRRRSICNN